jgi:hypothetical protein
MIADSRAVSSKAVIDHSSQGIQRSRRLELGAPMSNAKRIAAHRRASSATARPDSRGSRAIAKRAFDLITAHWNVLINIPYRPTFALRRHHHQ